MILYNVTVKIDHSVHDDWVAWMRSKHIPDVMRTGCFLSYSMCRVLGDDNEDGITYAIQYRSESLAEFQAYQARYAAILQKEHSDLFNGQYAAFRTLLEEVCSSNG